MSSTIIHPYMDANPESEQIIFNNFWRFLLRIRLLDTRKFFKKELARRRAFDSFTAPLRP
jgi:hypothetical protein